MIGKPTTYATEAWLRPDALYRYFTQNNRCSGVSYITDKSEIPNVINAVKPGDIVAYNNFDEVAKGEINHVAIVTSVSDGEIRIAGHSNTRHDESLYKIMEKTKYNGDIYFVHVNY